MVTPALFPVSRFIRIRAVVTILLSLFFLWLANPWHYYFLNDDFLAIPRAAEGHFIYGDLMRPVSDLTIWFDHLVWAKNAFGYHLTNTLIHILNSAMVYVFAQQLFRRFGTRKANVALKSWLASLLFLLYSSHSEPLFWIIGRGGSLSTLFFLVSCVSFMRRDRSRWYMVVCLASFFLGLLAYESVWIFPLIAALLASAESRQERRGRSAWPLVACIAGLFILYLILRLWQTGSVAGAYELRDLAGGRPGMLLYNYNTLLARCLLPPMADGKWFAGGYLLLLALIIGAVTVIVRKGKAGILPLLLGLGLLLALLPAVGLGIDTHTTESERFIYLPSVFWVLLLVEFLSILIPRPGFFLRVCIIVVLINGYGLWRASLSYRFAGEIVQHSLSCIGAGGPIEGAGVLRISNAGRRDSSVLYAVGLPSQYKGALIFRRGFAEAVHWMIPGYGNTDVRVISQATLASWREELACEESNPLQGVVRMHAANLNMAPPTEEKPGGELLVNLGDTTFSFEPGKDRVIYWTDSSVVKIGRIGK